MNTSEVLNGAADHIERYGHLKGEGHGPGDDVTTVPACAIGAINVAARFDDGTTPAISALRQHVGSIVRWNDAPERTAAEVVAALRAAAVIEAARESESAAVSA